jgi:hypothetical protein
MKYAETFRPRLHLRKRFFPAGVERGLALTGSRSGKLQEERRFSDAGFARYEDGGSRHESASQQYVQRTASSAESP